MYVLLYEHRTVIPTHDAYRHTGSSRRRLRAGGDLGLLGIERQERS